MKHFAIVFAIGVVLLICGCKGKEAQFVGTWTGPQNMSLVLKDDKTFTMGTSAMPQMAGGGHWKLDGDNASLQIETVGGKPAAEAIDQQLTQNAAALQSMHQDPVKLKKQALDSIAKPIVLTPDSAFKTLSGKGPMGASMSFTKASS